MTTVRYNKKQRLEQMRKEQRRKRLVGLLVVLVFTAVLIGGGMVVRASRPPTAAEKYADVPGPDDWTNDTPVKIYNRLNGLWEEKTYSQVGPDMEFIFGDYLYATTPEKGSLFLKPEIDITKLAETDQPFDPDNWRMPQPDDIVKVFRSDDPAQQKGHWLLKHVQPDSEVVFQGKVWKWELDLENQRFVVRDTGNVFARVTQTHVNFHEGDVLALTVKFDSCGKTDIITGSEEHPFYVLDGEDYGPMVDLKPDMRLKTDNGSLATVVELKPLDESMELYNLTIEHVNNYYIYTSEDDPGVLVHNTNCINLRSRPFASNSELNSGLIEQMYRGDWVNGQWVSADQYAGGLAGAVRRELATGELVGGVSHLPKGQQRISQMGEILRTGRYNGTAISQDDLAIVRTLHDDLLFALQGK